MGALALAEPTVSIDTLYLVRKLTSSQVGELKNQYKFDNRGNETFHHKIVHYNPFFIVYLLPRYRLQYMQLPYTIMINASQEALSKMPLLLQRILSIGQWKMKRLDVAYDFQVPMSKTFPLVAGNSKVETYGSTTYLYGKRNQGRGVIYDKRQQLIDKKEIDIGHDLTRFEIRLRPTLKDQPFLEELNFEWLKSHFDKFTFCPNFYELKLTSEQKKLLRTVKTRKNKDWTKIGRKKKEKLHAVIKQHRVDFYSLFNQQKEELFKHFIPYIPLMKSS